MAFIIQKNHLPGTCKEREKQCPGRWLKGARAAGPEALSTAVTGTVGVNAHGLKESVEKEKHRAKASGASPEVRVRKGQTRFCFGGFFVCFVFHFYFIFLWNQPKFFSDRILKGFSDFQ